MDSLADTPRGRDARVFWGAVHRRNGGVTIPPVEQWVLFARFPVVALCPRDARTTPDDVLVDIERTHPYLLCCGGRVVRTRLYVEPAALLCERARAQVDPLEGMEPDVFLGAARPGRRSRGRELPARHPPRAQRPLDVHRRGRLHGPAHRALPGLTQLSPLLVAHLPRSPREGRARRGGARRPAWPAGAPRGRSWTTTGRWGAAGCRAEASFACGRSGRVSE